jgi:RimJ/RimL family protein N-acetyltransferase
MLFRIDEREGNTSFAYWLTPAVHGDGYATEATSLTLDYAFHHRRLRRVRARVLETNDASIGLLEKLGFVHEGTQRQEKYVDGDPVDTRVYGLLREEWDETRETLDVDLD